MNTLKKLMKHWDEFIKGNFNEGDWSEYKVMGDFLKEAKVIGLESLKGDKVVFVWKQKRVYLSPNRGSVFGGKYTMIGDENWFCFPHDYFEIPHEEKDKCDDLFSRFMERFPFHEYIDCEN